ncbi:MAG: hypothetical protein VW270_22685 [Candidatus Poseidoniales archaeon]
MKEMTYKDAIHYGIVKDRDEETQRAFAQAIGTKANYRWHGGNFTLTPMQFAILDTMFDEPTETFTAQQMVCDHTRRAYVLQEQGEIVTEPNRLQASCGHDEQDAYRVQHWEFKMNDEGRWEQRTVLDSIASKGEFDYDTLQERNRQAFDQLRTDVLNITEQRYDAYRYDYDHDYTDNRHILPSSAYRMGDYDAYKGECAWENKRNPNNNTYCLHHGGEQHAHYIKIQEQYLEDMTEEQVVSLCTDDSNVLALIKKEIPKMKTEARDWLESERRGVYSSNINWVVQRRLEEIQEEKICKDLSGTQRNGWEFKGSKWHGQASVVVIYYNNHGRTDEHNRYNDPIKINSNMIQFNDVATAQVICDALNSQHRIDWNYIDGLPNSFYYPHEYNRSVYLERSETSLVDAYTPQQYFDACIEGTAQTQGTHRICTHKRSDEE